MEAREQWWHLPDGQTLRVIANPNPQGGMLIFTRTSPSGST
jgi:hypothetical protein